MSFLDDLALQTNGARTENGGASNASTLDAALDFYALGGALRSRPQEFVRLFQAAYFEEPLTALRTLFYLRDVRGGQGERDLFRLGLGQLAKLDRATYARNLALVPWYGRWDDLLAGDLSDQILDLIIEQLTADRVDMLNGASVSLLAKWMPSENTSSKATVAKARRIIEYWGLTEREYRIFLTTLRRYIGLLEQKMSAGEWDQVDYSKAPSQALRKHVKAFYRHDQERFEAFLAAVKKGEAKVNTSTLYTYEVFDLLGRGQNDAADVLWDNLPDYTQGKPALVVADVSGSMWSSAQKPMPLHVSVSLALYFAERNQGAFNGYFMTFSENPKLVKVPSNITLSQKLNAIQTADWGMNTDIEKAFDAILAAAVKAKASPDELPQVLYIISDMEFDACTDVNETAFQTAQRKFAAAGYKLPHVVFWNVAARNTHLAATKFDNNVTLVSGSGQSTFAQVVAGKSPRDSMLDVVNSERYAALELAR